MADSTDRNADRLVDPPAQLRLAAEKLSDAGLREHVDSWISTGPNQPVTPEQITEALGAERLARIAEKAGADTDEVAAGLAEELPRMFDEVSPQGRVIIDMKDINESPDGLLTVAQSFPPQFSQLMILDLSVTIIKPDGTTTLLSSAIPPR